MSEDFDSIRFKKRAYSLDELTLVPGARTVDPDLCSVTFTLGEKLLPTPILASAMDSVVSPQSAASLSRQGVLAVLNLQGLWTRYLRAEDQLAAIASSPDTDYISLMQRLYAEPVKAELVEKRIAEMKASCSLVAVSSVPQDVLGLLPIIEKGGVDFLFVQSTVTSTVHVGVHKPLQLAELCAQTSIPVIAGNCSNYQVARELLKSGIAGLLIGIGPGAACTSRGVLGIGVPMGTAIIDGARARDDHFAETGERIAVIADGGILNSGDICKALACGADGVMLGSVFSRAEGAPGLGFHWGMATPSPVLPRGTRIKVRSLGSYEKIVHGPASLDNGLHNLIGALKTSMGTLGAQNIGELQGVDIYVAPSILAEGKAYQSAQRLGMGSL